ncbi:MAG: hypothetical protein NTZ93_00760 [Candidatus Beckwithbacteria bacterium]|nr:hypothetical protein [Candidatus Beckwithbacteria bacterium]
MMVEAKNLSTIIAERDEASQYYYLLESVSPLSEKIQKERQKRLVVCGVFDQCPLLMEFIDKLGFTTVSSTEMIGVNPKTPLLIAFPRNAFIQLGTTIVARSNINADYLEIALRRNIETLGGNPDKLRLVRDDYLGNGGRFMAEAGLVVGPEDYFLLEHVQRILDQAGCEGKNRIALPWPSMNDYSSWLSSKKSDEYFERLIEWLPEWKIGQLKFNYTYKIRASYPDLDLFVGVGVDAVGKPGILLDDMYAEIYPEAIEAASSRVAVYRVNPFEANRFLSCNFFSVGKSIDGRVALTVEGAEVTQETLIQNFGYRNVFGFPIEWVVDKVHGAAFHCRFNVVDLSVFK